MKNRYLLFAGQAYYPRGGSDDLQGAFESIESAYYFTMPSNSEWGEILDVQTMKVVGRYYDGRWWNYMECRQCGKEIRPNDLEPNLRYPDRNFCSYMCHHLRHADD